MSKSNGKPKKHGRPTAYRKKFNAQTYAFSLLGDTDKVIAQRFGVSEVTLNAWKKKHPTFLKSLKDGRAIADAEVTHSLYQRARGYKQNSVKIFNDNGKPLIVPYVEHFPPDPTSMIFWLKNRRPDMWREQIQHELAGVGGGPIQHRFEVVVTTCPERVITDVESKVVPTNGDGV